MILNSENYYQTICCTTLFIIVLISVVFIIGSISVNFNLSTISSKDYTIMLFTTIILLFLGSSFVYYLATTADTISDNVVMTPGGPRNFVSINKE